MLKTWIQASFAGIVLFLAAAAIFTGTLWIVSEIDVSNDVRFAATFIFGVAFLLLVISAIVAAFSALRLTSPKSALGLPEGSIRAIIALVLILVFILMAIYLIEAVFLGDDADEQAKNAATQLIATVGTLVAAVAAFYFGTGAVQAGIGAATAAVGVSRGRPAAITKGSKPLDDGGYELVGVVNPRGVETRYYFEYGPEKTYGSTTPMASAGAGNEERHVGVGPTEDPGLRNVVPGWHLRFVAFNDSGTSYGADAVIDPLPGGQAAADQAAADDAAADQAAAEEADTEVEASEAEVDAAGEEAAAEESAAEPDEEQT